MHYLRSIPWADPICIVLPPFHAGKGRLPIGLESDSDGSDEGTTVQYNPSSNAQREKPGSSPIAQHGEGAAEESAITIGPGMC